MIIVGLIQVGYAWVNRLINKVAYIRRARDGYLKKKEEKKKT